MSLEESAAPAFTSSPAAGADAVFDQPWQARAFALMLKLREHGHFTANEWSTALGHALREPAQPGETTETSSYYAHWLAALESLVLAKGLADPHSLQTRKEAWADAYRRTPHGKPVELL